MNDKEKASALLQFMEDEWDGKAIINALNPYLKDEDLAGLYDNLQKDGVIRDEDPDDDLPEDLRGALAYVREQLGEDRLAVVRAQANVCYEQRRPIKTDYNDEVYGLLEEWGEEHDHCEEWWSESFMFEDIVARL